MYLLTAAAPNVLVRCEMMVQFSNLTHDLGEMFHRKFDTAVHFTNSMTRFLYLFLSQEPFIGCVKVAAITFFVTMHTIKL